MLISAVNAMTMTPARAAWIFGHRKPRSTTRKARGAAVVVLRADWRIDQSLAAHANLLQRAGGGRGEAFPADQSDAAELAARRRLVPPRRDHRRRARLVHRAAGELGSGQILRWFQPPLRARDSAYGKTVGWTLRASAIVLVLYVGLIGLTMFGFIHCPVDSSPFRTRGTS